MLYFVVDITGALVQVTEELNRADTTNAKCRWDFVTLADAEAMATKATNFTGALHIATDSGPHVSPRFDVVAAPTVGAEVSKGFNGDYYPCGKIAKISKTLKKIETDTGVVFYRRGTSGAWVNKGMWSMVPGTRKEWNPSF